jgi:hypothetical protein
VELLELDMLEDRGEAKDSPWSTSLVVRCEAKHNMAYAKKPNDEQFGEMTKGKS